MIKLQTDKLAYHNEDTDEFWIVDDDQFKLVSFEEIMNVFTDTYGETIPIDVLPNVLLDYLDSLPEDEVIESEDDIVGDQPSIFSFIEKIIYSMLQRSNQITSSQADTMLKLQQLKLMILEEDK